MKKSNTAFITTVFPASELFLNDFFKSLINQTTKDFDVLVVNDGISNFDNYKKLYSELNIIEFKSGATPAINREIGINKALCLGYDILVFGDSDDYFSNNRVLESVKSLSKYDVVFNELTIINNGDNIENFLKSNNIDAKSAQNYIVTSNVFGLSNTAINTKVIGSNVCFDDNIIAVDWFFFSSILFGGNYTIGFLEDVNTFYRQHFENTIGMSLLLTEQKLQTGLMIKEQHYISLNKYFEKAGLNSNNITLKKALNELYELKKMLKANDFRKDYIDFVNKNSKLLFTGWWSEIITLNKYYENENKN